MVKKPEATRQVILPLRKATYLRLPTLSLMRKAEIGPFFRTLALARKDKDLQRWNRMACSFESENFPLEAYLEAEPASKTFSKRLEKGPPPQYRWQAWVAVRHLGAKINEEVYEALPTACPFSLGPLQLAFLFPTEAYFHSPEIGDKGREALINVLSKLVGKYPELDCGSGLEQVAGFALLVSGGNEVETFFFLEDLLQEEKLMSFFSSNKGHYLRCAELLSESLHRHLPSVMVSLENCREERRPQSWLLTLFTSAMPLEGVARVWDCYMANGVKMLLKVAVAFLRMHQDAIMTMERQELSDFLASISQRSFDIELLIHQSFRVSINARKLAHLQDSIPPLPALCLPPSQPIITSTLSANPSPDHLFITRRPSKSLTSKVPVLPQIRHKYPGPLFTWETLSAEEDPDQGEERPVAAREVLEELLREQVNLSTLSLESLSNLPPKPSPKVDDYITFVSRLPL